VAAAAHAPGTENTALLIDVARHLDRFIGRLFHIETEVAELNRCTADDRAVYDFKKRFLDRVVLKSPAAADELSTVNMPDVEFRYRERVAEVLSRGEWADDPERELAEVAVRLLDRQTAARARGDDAEVARIEAMLGDVSAWARAVAFHPELKERRR